MSVAKVQIDKEVLEEVVKKVITEYDKQLFEKSQKRRDKRLRNTKLLLRNYNNFSEHCKNAVYVNSKIEDEEDPIDILMESECDSEDLFINSIKRTHTRTKIILDHIESIMNYYRFKADNSKDSKFIRRFKVLDLVYFNENHYTYEQLGEMFDVDTKTISRDIKKAIQELSVLMFGVDGIKLEI